MSRNVTDSLVIEHVQLRLNATDPTNCCLSTLLEELEFPDRFAAAPISPHRRLQLADLDLLRGFMRPAPLTTAQMLTRAPVHQRVECVDKTHARKAFAAHDVANYMARQCKNLKGPASTLAAQLAPIFGGTFQNYRKMASKCDPYIYSQAQGATDIDRLEIPHEEMPLDLRLREMREMKSNVWECTMINNCNEANLVLERQREVAHRLAAHQTKNEHSRKRKKSTGIESLRNKFLAEYEYNVVAVLDSKTRCERQMTALQTCESPRPSEKHRLPISGRLH